jgi:hypothetical protein
MTDNRSRMLEIVRRIRFGEYIDDVECNFLVEELENITLDPNICDYVFQSGDEVTPETIVDLALSYKPIIGEWIE